jgi:hypothetical protein
VATARLRVRHGRDGVAAAQLVGEILEHGEVGSADELAGLLEELDQWVHDKQANLLEAPEDAKRDWAAYLAQAREQLQAALR